MPTEVPSAPLPFLGSLARSPRDEDRLLWLRVATDYFLRAETPEDAIGAEFESNFSFCLAACDDEGRLAVARKLIARPRASTRLWTIIADFGGEAARCVLERAPNYPKAALREAMNDVASLRAVARRDDLDAQMIEAILERDDIGATIALCANARAPLQPSHLRELGARASAFLEAGWRRRVSFSKRIRSSGPRS